MTTERTIGLLSFAGLCYYFYRKYFAMPKMGKKNIAIPRRDLTVESTTELSHTLKRAVAEMLTAACPCRYPRFRYLVTFFHENYFAGPVFCADTNYLSGIACDKNDGSFELSSVITENVIGSYGQDYLYTCRCCGSVIKEICKQYGINFEFRYLVILKHGDLPDVGASLITPFPVLQGFFGFQDSDILKCSKEFMLGNAEQVFQYLTEKENANDDKC